MPRTKLDRQSETIRDPCRQFRILLKRKQYDEEHRPLFGNKDIAGWLHCSEGNASAKMNGKRDLSVRDIRLIMEHVEFSKDEKARIFD